MPKILYVEDDPINAFVLKKMLSVFEIQVATSVNECISIAKSESFDLILMDINLGDSDEDGISCMKDLRENGYDSTPIVALTAYAMNGDQERFISEGFDAYLSKPVQKKDILEKIENLLAK